MLVLLAKLLFAVVFFGPVLAAFVTAPVEPLAAWPVWSLIFAPAAFVLVVSTLFRAYWPLVDAPLRDSAGVWLQKTLGRLGLIGVSVAAIDRAERGRGNFYHPASRIIVLDEDVHGEHTARAYATAAHELGHAILHSQRPWLSAVLLAARGHADRFFYRGVALLFGTVLAGAPALRVVAFAFVAVAVVLQALVVVDETIASATARDFLRDDLGDADQGRIARGHLRGALATYVSLLVAYLLPLAVAPWVLDGATGLIPPGAPLSGAASVLAYAGAGLAVAGPVAALVLLARPWRTFVDLVLAFLVFLLAVCWAPLLTTLVCDQADMPRWTVALAAVPTLSILVSPALLVVRWFASKLAPGGELLPLPLHASLGAGVGVIPRVTRKQLREREDPPSFFRSAMAWAYTLWMLPLALAWLGWL